METEDDIYRAFKSDVERFGKSTIVTELGIEELMSIISLAQLGLRHPGYKGPSGKIAAEVIRGFVAQLEGYPGIQKTIELGFDRRYDT